MVPALVVGAAITNTKIYGEMGEKFGGPQHLVGKTLNFLKSLRNGVFPRDTNWKSQAFKRRGFGEWDPPGANFLIIFPG